MRRLLHALVTTSFVATVLGSSVASALSPRRGSGESFEDALQRNAAALPPTTLDGAASVWASRRAVQELDDTPVPAWDEATLRRAFVQARDARFLFADSRPSFARRSSWLYPDDGCFARAALAADNLARWGYARPARVFVFGKLAVDTPNSPEGRVRWWYHVAPVVKVDGVLHVIDPSIESRRPLTLAAWIGAQTDDQASVTASLCNGHAYVPSSACLDARPESERSAVSDQRRYLELEWARQERLGRDPAEVLGEKPLWAE